jgi:hypothetical protein
MARIHHDTHQGETMNWILRMICLVLCSMGAAIGLAQSSAWWLTTMNFVGVFLCVIDEMKEHAE